MFYPHQHHKIRIFWEYDRDRDLGTLKVYPSKRKILIGWWPQCCGSRLNQECDLNLERLRHIGFTTASVGFSNLLGYKNHKASKQIDPLVKNSSVGMQLWRPTKMAPRNDPSGSFNL